MIHELIDDLEATLASMPAGQVNHKLLAGLRSALGRDISLLHQFPTATFQSLFNHFWWQDCAEAEEHFRVPATFLEQEARWQRGSPPYFHEIAAAWRTEKELAIPGVSWLRALRPVGPPLGASKRLILRGHSGPVLSLAASPDGRKLFSASGMRGDRKIRVWDARTGQQIQAWELPSSLVQVNPRLAMSSTGILAAVSAEQLLLVDSTSLNILRILPGTIQQHSPVVFSDDGSRVAAGTWHRSPVDQQYGVTIWDTNTAEIVTQLPGSPEPARGLAFASDGVHLAVGSLSLKTPGKERGSIVGRDSIVEIWNLEAKTVAATLEQPGPVSVVRFSPDGSLLVTAADNPRAAPRGRLCDFPPVSMLLSLVTLGPQSRFTGFGGPIRFWDWRTGTLRDEIGNRSLGTKALCFSNDGTSVVVATIQFDERVQRLCGGISRFDLPSKERSYLFSESTGEYHSLVHLAESDTYACAGYDNRIQVFGSDQTIFAPRLIDQAWVIRMSFTSSGRFLLSSGVGQIAIWRSEVGRLEEILQCPVDRTACPTFSPNNRCFAAVTARSSGRRLRRSVSIWYRKQYSAQSKWLDPRMRNWGDVYKSFRIRELKAAGEQIHEIAWSPDGTQIAALCQTHVLIWRLDEWLPGLESASALQVLWRSLSRHFSRILPLICQLPPALASSLKKRETEFNRRPGRSALTEAAGNLEWLNLRVRFSNDGQHVLCGEKVEDSEEFKLSVVWNSDTGVPAAVSDVHGKSSAADFRADAVTVVSEPATGVTSLRNAVSREVIAALAGECSSFAVHPGARLLARETHNHLDLLQCEGAGFSIRGSETTQRATKVNDP